MKNNQTKRLSLLFFFTGTLPVIVGICNLRENEELKEISIANKTIGESNETKK